MSQNIQPLPHEFDFKNILEMMKGCHTQLLKRMSISWKTRFDYLYDRINEIWVTEYGQTNESQKDIENIKPMLQYMGEAVLFIEICKHLLRIKDHQLPRRVISRYLEGQPECWDEPNPKSSQARDHQFELLLMMVLMNNGATIERFEDVIIKFSRKKYSIQCKRIRSLDTLSNNIEEAYVQLVKHKQIHNNEYGYIAICLDIPFEFEKRYFDNIEQRIIDEELDSRFEMLRSKITKIIISKVSQNFLGVICITKYLRLDRLNGTIHLIPKIATCIYSTNPMNEYSRKAMLDFNGLIK